MSNDLPLDGFQCVVLGSYRRSLAEIQRACQLFRSFGIKVLYPPAADPAHEADGFVFLQGQEAEDPALLQTKVILHIAGMGRNGFVYVCNPGGYLGRAVCYELGRVHGREVPFFFLEAPNDPGLAWLRHEAFGIMTPAELAAALLRAKGVPDLRPQTREV